MTNLLKFAKKWLSKAKLKARSEAKYYRKIQLDNLLASCSRRVTITQQRSYRLYELLSKLLHHFDFSSFLAFVFLNDEKFRCHTKMNDKYRLSLLMRTGLTIVHR